MKFQRILLLSLLSILPLSSYAGGRTIFCNEPMGPRLDYFTQNTANLQNNQFLVGRDQMNDVRIRIVLDDNNQDVSFVVGSDADLQKTSPTNNMKIVFATTDQVSFLGKVNEAPILATYYPSMNILIYTQQSVWPGDSFSGARAMLFYARCNVGTPPGAAPTAEQVQGLAVPPDAVPPATEPAATAPAAAMPAGTVPAAPAPAPAASAPADMSPAATAPAAPAQVTQ